jgi:hypothetical protein
VDAVHFADEPAPYAAMFPTPDPAFAAVVDLDGALHIEIALGVSPLAPSARLAWRSLPRRVANVAAPQLERLGRVAPAPAAQRRAREM